MKTYKNVIINHCGYNGFSGTYVNPRGGNDVYFSNHGDLKALYAEINQYFKREAA